MARNPQNDFLLLNLKNIALRGGDRGPYYDQGDLAAISQIENKGSFTRGGIASILTLMQMQENLGGKMLTPEEEAQGHQLAQHGWTLQQGNEYANGVFIVELAVVLRVAEKERIDWLPPSVSPQVSGRTAVWKE